MIKIIKIINIIKIIKIIKNIKMIKNILMDSKNTRNHINPEWYESECGSEFNGKFVKKYFW